MSGGEKKHTEGEWRQGRSESEKGEVKENRDVYSVTPWGRLSLLQKSWDRNKLPSEWSNI